MKPKAGIYDPYLDTLGGGERYSLTVAEVLSQHGYDVDVFWSGNHNILSKASDRFSLDLSNVNITPDIFCMHPQSVDCVDDTSQLKKLSQHHHLISNIKTKINQLKDKYQVTKKYDVFFYVSDGSIPLIFSKKSLIHFQVPFTQKLSQGQMSLNKLKLNQISKVVCNSKFTKKVIDHNFSTNSDVLYPPVDVAKFFNNAKKENIILSVGRFDNIMNAKKQDVLIETFKKLPSNILQNWQLVLMGGSLENPDTNHYLRFLKDIAQNYPISFKVNPSFEELQATYAHAKIYWHAAGYQVDEQVHPEFTEHFGMAVVEAMASGQIPIIVNQGGLPEIIQNKKNGYLWEDVESLAEITTKLIADEKVLTKMASLAIESSLSFSKERFTENLMQLLK